jgi:carbamoyltransferase
LILSIYCGPHNGSITISDNSKIIYYSQEEQFTTLKYDKNIWCSLLDVNTKFSHFDLVVLNSLYPDEWIPDRDVYRLRSIFENNLLNFTYDNFIYNNETHHLYHAALGFYHSGFDKALCVVIDGHGAITYKGRESGTIILAEMPDIFRHKYQRWCPITDENVVVQKLVMDSDGEEIATLEDVPIVPNEFNRILGHPCKSSGAIYEEATQTIENWTWEDAGKFMGLAECKGYEDLIEERWRVHIDFAHKIHNRAEQNAIELIDKALTYDDTKNIVLSGGYFLNCVSNYEYLAKYPDKNIFVEPIGYDCGISMGQALYYDPPKEIKEINNIYYGYNDHEYSLLKNYQTHTASYADIVNLLISKNIVAIFQGGVEAGPRALGNRSLLFDPRDPNGKEIVNTVKMRESFRPFAGAILEKYVHDWFDTRGLDKSPFMMYAMKCKQKEEIPAVLHYNETSRIQTVTTQQNYHFYNLIEEFYFRTGVPILLNTSFNLAGWPIVMDIKQAINTLENSLIEYLYIPEENKLVVIKND